MLKKLLYLVISISLTLSAYGGTLFITAKKVGQPEIHFEHPYVIDYGWNTAGAFVVRLNSGEEIFYGKRSHWENFDYTYVPDSDQLIKY